MTWEENVASEGQDYIWEPLEEEERKKMEELYQKTFFGKGGK